MQYLVTPKFEIDDIEEITLLSKEEYENCKNIIPQSFCWWWLRSPGLYSHYAAYVSIGGDFSNCGNEVYYDCIGIRPAFRISNLNLKVGEVWWKKVFVGNLLCTIIDNDYVLSDTVIEMHNFDSGSNDWEISELKSYINSNEFKEKIGLHTTNSIIYGETD